LHGTCLVSAVRRVRRVSLAASSRSRLTGSSRLEPVGQVRAKQTYAGSMCLDLPSRRTSKSS
jgi:hypothetical protein